MTRRAVPFLFPAIAILFACQSASAQLTYSKGQSIAPAYEGWQKNDDGSFNLLFGYMNSNWEEELDVPVGPGNQLEPGGPDQGQPTHFFPRRNRFVFKVHVPADFGDKEIVWTLVTHGKTLKAYASLRQDLYVDNMIIMSESGGIGGGVTNPKVRANQPPVLKIDGDNVRTVRVGEPLRLSMHATDDGVPGRRPRFPVFNPPREAVKDLRLIPPIELTVDSATGLWATLYRYRGAGNVTFSPVQPKVWEDTRMGANSPWSPLWSPPPVPADGNWKVEATFDDPGLYTLRWHASDGALAVDQDITVIVAP